MLATQLEELAQKRAAAIQAAIRAQSQQTATSPVVEREVATQLAEFADMQKQHVESGTPTKTASVQPQKDTMYHLYERAVVESYKSTDASNTDASTSGSATVSNQQDKPAMSHQGVAVTTVATSQIAPSVGVFTKQQEINVQTSNTEITTTVFENTGGAVFMSSSQKQMNPSEVPLLEMRQHSETVVSERIQGTQDLVGCVDDRKFETPVVQNTVPKFEIDRKMEDNARWLANDPNDLGTNKNHIENPDVSNVSGSWTENIPEGREEQPSQYPSVSGVEQASRTASTMSISNPNDTHKHNAVFATQTEGQQLSTTVASDGSQSAKDPTPVFVQNTLPGETDSLGSRPYQQENVCQDSEMRDLSHTASISPGVNRNCTRPHFS